MTVIVSPAATLATPPDIVAGPTIVKLPYAVEIDPRPRVCPFSEDKSRVKAEAADVRAAAQIDDNSSLFIIYSLGLELIPSLLYVINP